VCGGRGLQRPALQTLRHLENAQTLPCRHGCRRCVPRARVLRLHPHLPARPRPSASVRITPSHCGSGPGEGSQDTRLRRRPPSPRPRPSLSDSEWMPPAEGVTAAVGRGASRGLCLYGLTVLRKAGKPVLRKAGKPALHKAGKPVLRKAGKPEIRNYGKPVLRNHGEPASRKALQHYGTPDRTASQVSASARANAASLERPAGADAPLEQRPPESRDAAHSCPRPP
jgi:hypothetical protein